MKITLLHYSAPPIVGGVESILAAHARLLAGDGHSVQVIAGRGEQFHPDVEFLSIPLVDSNHVEVLAVKKGLDAGLVPAQFEELKRAILQVLTPALQASRVLIVHNVCSLNKNLALTAALKEIASQTGSPRLILWHHDLAWTTPRYRSELHNGYPWNLLSTDWPGAVQVVVSHERRRELAELLAVSPERIHIVPNGIDIPTFLSLDQLTCHLAEQSGAMRADPLFLLPVRITRRKNIELAVRIMDALRHEFSNPVLIVTGPPGPHNTSNYEYFSSLKTLRADLGLKGQVHFLADYDAHLPDNVIHEFYRLADALLLPSREEGFGIPILEAGVARLPVFCTDIPPLVELGGEQVVTFSPGESPSRVAAIIGTTLKANPAYILSSRVKREYNWGVIYREKIAPLLEAG